jgi:hypothetical protein
MESNGLPDVHKKLQAMGDGMILDAFIVINL